MYSTGTEDLDRYSIVRPTLLGLVVKNNVGSNILRLTYYLKQIP